MQLELKVGEPHMKQLAEKIKKKKKKLLGSNLKQRRGKWIRSHSLLQTGKSTVEEIKSCRSKEENYSSLVFFAFLLVTTTQSNIWSSQIWHQLHICSKATDVLNHGKRLYNREI